MPSGVIQHILLLQTHILAHPFITVDPNKMSEQSKLNALFCVRARNMVHLLWFGSRQSDWLPLAVHSILPLDIIYIPRVILI